VIHLRKIAIKPVLYFPPQLFSAPLLYLVRQATNLTDIHSDEHQNRIVKPGKSQDKRTLTKHAETSQESHSNLMIKLALLFWSLCVGQLFTWKEFVCIEWLAAVTSVFCCYQQVSDIHSHLLFCFHIDLSEISSFNCP